MDNFAELAKLSKDVADDTPLLAALALRFEAGAVRTCVIGRTEDRDDSQKQFIVYWLSHDWNHLQSSPIQSNLVYFLQLLLSFLFTLTLLHYLNILYLLLLLYSFRLLPLLTIPLPGIAPSSYTSHSLLYHSFSFPSLFPLLSHTVK